jgi:hypothetical protein
MDDRIRAGRAGTAGEPEAAGPPTASSAMPTLTGSPRSPEAAPGFAALIGDGCSAGPPHRGLMPLREAGATAGIAAPA